MQIYKINNNRSNSWMKNLKERMKKIERRKLKNF